MVLFDALVLGTLLGLFFKGLIEHLCDSWC